MSRSLVKASLCALAIAVVPAALGQESVPTYEELRRDFAAPDHARWGEVPLWWWEGDRLSRERVSWQLETLAKQGVKSVCPIQRSPGRCDPQSFTPEWWDMLAYVSDECRRLGMTLWAYDQVGYGHYGWLEKAAAKAQDTRTARVAFLTAEGSPDKPVRLELPEGKLLGARAYRIAGGLADDAGSIDLEEAGGENVLHWTPPAGDWRVAVSVAVPELGFQLSDTAADTFLDMFYGQIERRLGRDALGSTFVGVFQDEHPPTPRDVYTDRLAKSFRERFGYPLGRAIPALHFDVGPLTPKYRTDFFDAYLAEDERSYWKRVYDWTHQRGLLTSHDNWGRNSLPMQSQGYIDYFRTQRWFSAPGYDDAGQHPVDRRNYYDTKIAASIARLYGRPRVWSEAFHSSGWGRTTDQTLSWLSANYAFGANLYDEHGLYYSARASTWEHAAPDPHWRQPYWRYYGVLSDWVARMSCLMSQGEHVVDAAVHYPAVSHLAGEPPEVDGPDYNLYMRLSRTIYDAGIDNDVIDDDSILAGTVNAGRLVVAGGGYQALVFGPETTVRRDVVRQALRLAESGGTVLFFGRLPSASTEGGRDDPELASLLEQLLESPPTETTPEKTVAKRFPSGGFCALVPSGPEELPRLLTDRIDRDFTAEGGKVFVAHRRIGPVDVYLIQNATEAPIDLSARCRVDGVPELWDPFTGAVSPVQRFDRRDGRTQVDLPLEGNTAAVLVFRPGPKRSGGVLTRLVQPAEMERTLPDRWAFSVIPTRDNRWGEFRWPPSRELIGPEVRSFRYAEETSAPGTELGWHRADFDDVDWLTARYSIGPYWLLLQPPAGDADVVPAVLDGMDRIAPGAPVDVAGKPLSWQPVEFSKTIGLARPAPWGGHSGYPDGAVDQNFIELPKGRKLLFTRIRSPKRQRLGLRVELRNATPRLWVGGVEQPLEGAVGNLPLEEGDNTVLLDLPDGGRGMLFVDAEPPSVASMEEAAAAQSAGPDLQGASWIRGSNTGSGYVRKVFHLDQVPADARVVVTAYTGYRLFLNGVKIEEEIGPWAKWTHPESINVARHLRPGENVLAAWVQVHSGQHSHGTAADQGFVLAMKARMPDGRTLTLATDGSWKGTDREADRWQAIGFDDSAWPAVEVLGRMGVEPWGMEPVENVGAVTEPRRLLAIDLASPYLTCFDEVPEIVYDVRPDVPQGENRIGWFRFLAPPGVRELLLRTTAKARVWVDGVEADVRDGVEAEVRDGVARVANPPADVSQVAVRLEMEPGAYGGAAFPLPIGLRLAGGTIRPGPWADFGLPTYSGIGVYRQDLTLTAAETKRRTELDLGEVLVAAEVLLNGKPVGVRLARPFKFDLTGLLREGANAIEVRVANTIAPHYTVTNQVQNLGPTDSGLVGPVKLRQWLPQTSWVQWAKEEVARLHEQLDTSTPELEAAQAEWEKVGRWTRLEPVALDAKGSTVRLSTNLTGITGFRVETPSHEIGPRDLDIVARLPKNARFRGRTVRVEMVDRHEYLHLAEVRVLSDGRNVALQGRARQSSTFPEAPASLAIDGNTEGSWGAKSVCHTLKEDNPWWEVDLGSQMPVDRIVVHNRTDGDLETRLSNFRVSLSDASGGVVWERLVSTPPDPHVELHLSPIPVRLSSPKAGRDKQGRRHVTLFETEEEIGFPGGTVLDVKPADASGSGAEVRRLRISAATMPRPLVDVPPPIAEVLVAGPQERSDRQKAALAAFYRSVTPELAPVRRRLAQLTSQLERVERRAPK